MKSLVLTLTILLLFLTRFHQGRDLDDLVKLNCTVIKNSKLDVPLVNGLAVHYALILDVDRKAVTMVLPTSGETQQPDEVVVFNKKHVLWINYSLDGDQGAFTNNLLNRKTGVLTISSTSESSRINSLKVQYQCVTSF